MTHQMLDLGDRLLDGAEGQRVGQDSLQGANSDGTRQQKTNQASCQDGSWPTSATLVVPRCYRFFNVMLIPKLSIMMNDVSRSGLVVMAFM